MWSSKNFHLTDNWDKTGEWSEFTEIHVSQVRYNF